MSENQALAAVVLDPLLRHAQLAFHTGGRMVQHADGATTADAVDVMTKGAIAARNGEMRYASDTLFAQAHTLDTLMTEMIRRAWHNVGEYPRAFDRYMTLAMKAQAQSRATLEALAKLHQPREQVVRHVHVYEGGQAVVAEEFHNHPGGINAGNAHQPQEQHGEGAPSAALPRPDAFRNGVPVSGSKGAQAVPNTRRRQGQRRTSRQS